MIFKYTSRLVLLAMCAFWAVSATSHIGTPVDPTPMDWIAAWKVTLVLWTMGLFGWLAGSEHAKDRQ